MLLGLALISAIARPRQVRKLPRCESGGGKVLCPYYSCRCRRATTAMPEISEFRFAPDSPVEGSGFELVWGFSCQVVVLGFAESSLFGAGKPFFIPSPAIRFPERAEGVKGPKR